MLKRRTIFILFLIAFFAHLALLRFYGIGSATARPIDLDRAAGKRPDQYIEVTPLTPAELAQSSAHQIIEVPPGPDEDPGPDAKYLASRAMRADKETMARPGPSFAGHAGPPAAVAGGHVAPTRPPPPDRPAWPPTALPLSFAT